MSLLFFVMPIRDSFREYPLICDVTPASKLTLYQTFS